MKDPIKTTLKRAGSTLIRAMENGDHQTYAMIDSLVGEPPHAVVIVAVGEKATSLLKKLNGWNKLPKPGRRKK